MIKKWNSLSLVIRIIIVSVIQDSMETALNSSSDVIFTATAEFLEWEKEGKELPI